MRSNCINLIKYFDYILHNSTHFWLGFSPSEKPVNGDRHRLTQVDTGHSNLIMYKMIDVYSSILMSVDRCICANISSHFDPPTSPTSRSCVCAHLIDDLAIPDLWLVVYATFVSLRASHLHAPSHYFPITPRYHLDKRHLYMPKTTKIYRCNCKKHCKGQEKVLGRKAYYAYKKYHNHDPVSQFS
jgi:hypothetical protein